MKMIISLLKALQVEKLISIFLVGTLILTTTFSNTVLADKENLVQGGEGSLDRSFYEEKILDKATDPSRTEPGQMYPYSDVDPRFDNRRAEKKAERLSENASENTDKQSLNVVKNIKRALDKQPENLEEARQNTSQAGQRLGQKAERGLSEFAENASQGTENLKKNARTAANKIPKIVEDTTERAKSNIGLGKDTFAKDKG